MARKDLLPGMQDKHGFTVFELCFVIVVGIATAILIGYGIRLLTVNITHVACAGRIRTIKAQYLVDYQTTRPDTPASAEALLRNDIDELYPDAFVSSIDSTASHICPGGGTYRYEVDTNGHLSVVCSLHGNTGQAVEGIPSQIEVDSWADTIGYATDSGSADVVSGAVYHDQTGTYAVLSNQKVTKDDVSGNTALSNFSITHSWLVHIDFGALLTIADQDDDSDTGSRTWRTIPSKGSIYLYEDRYYVFAGDIADKTTPTDPESSPVWVLLAQS